MKQKLSVTIDPDLATWAREFAAREDITVSRLVMIGLRRVQQQGQLDFVEKWRGALKLRKRPGDPRMEYLIEKYGLEERSGED
jgi:hypothetical protein